MDKRLEHEGAGRPACHRAMADIIEVEPETGKL